MSSYYYLVASLPMLHLEEASPISLEAFIGMCSQGLSPSDFELVRSASIDPRLDSDTTGHSYLRRWNKIVAMVKGELSEQRAKKLSRDLDHYKNSGDKNPWIGDLIRSVMQAENPLQAELLLLSYFWKQAEDLATGHVFDVDFIISYYLKLQMVTRRSLFTPMEGNAEFKRLFSNLQTTIKSI